MKRELVVLWIAVNQVDPSQFIITRKRKKYKFAKFANAQNCFEFDEWRQQDEHGRAHIDVVEIGAGTGLFVVELAARHPGRRFVAVDVKADRLQKGAYAALERGLDNVYFVRARADQAEELFAPGSLSAIWLTFSDPFPKPRSAGRRMTHPTFLKKYANLLTRVSSLNGRDDPSCGGLLVKHDNPEFFQWTLEQLVAEGWKLGELSFDLHESELHEDYKVLTTYEQRWLGEGRITQLVRATKPRAS